MAWLKYPERAADCWVTIGKKHNYRRDWVARMLKEVEQHGEQILEKYEQAAKK